uniref:Uncharacterized protein n=1 Tax=Nelumbo nucifera TaxID=4432 RepID=A0A822Z3B1_NELNU|nr:TPA_asm: hypothetical protein HUJ06_013483 [Nelumbo nucifera]
MAHNNPTSSALSVALDEETQEDQSKNTQKTISIIAVSTAAIAGGALFNSPPAKSDKESPIYEFLSRAYTISIAVSLGLSLAILLLVLIQPTTRRAVPTAKAMSWVTLALLLFGVSVWIYLVLMHA